MLSVPSMDISLINSQSLLRLLSLTERKEELLKLIEDIDAAIIQTLQGAVAVQVVEITSSAVTKPEPKRIKPVGKSLKSTRKTKAGKPVGLKDRILALLGEAGDQGLHVKEIAEKLGSKATNISVWFSTTGKKLAKKVEPGRYAVKGKDGTPEPAVPPVKASKPAKPTKAKKKGGITPEGRARLAANMKSRWAARKAGRPAKKAVKKPGEKGFKLPKIEKNPF